MGHDWNIRLFPGNTLESVNKLKALFACFELSYPKWLVHAQLILMPLGLPRVWNQHTPCHCRWPAENLAETALLVELV